MIVKNLAVQDAALPLFNKYASEKDYEYVKNIVKSLRGLDVSSSKCYSWKKICN